VSKLISYNVHTDSYSVNNDVFDTIELQKSYQNNTPFPLKCPEDCSRNSIAVYYYTKHKDPNYHKVKTMETTYAKTRDSNVNMSLFDKLKKDYPFNHQKTSYEKEWLI
jgi:hypothetical protein